jgi:hypothetical protein
MANSTYQNMVGYTNDELKKLTPLDITPAGEREINKAFSRSYRKATDLDTALCF